jgi:hypothetical protein
MDASNRRPWIRAALLVGLAYLAIGRLFTFPTEHVQVWRLAAWVASGAVYAAHIWYERFILRNSTRATALHVAVAVAIGSFTLAVAAMTRSLYVTSAIRPVWLLALVLWPAFTAVPAYLVALGIAAVLPRRAQSGDPR